MLTVSSQEDALSLVVVNKEVGVLALRRMLACHCWLRRALWPRRAKSTPLLSTGRQPTPRTGFQSLTAWHECLGEVEVDYLGGQVLIGEEVAERPCRRVFAVDARFYSTKQVRGLLRIKSKVGLCRSWRGVAGCVGEAMAACRGDRGQGHARGGRQSGEPHRGSLGLH